MHIKLVVVVVVDVVVSAKKNVQILAFARAVK